MFLYKDAQGNVLPFPEGEHVRGGQYEYCKAFTQKAEMKFWSRGMRTFSSRKVPSGFMDSTPMDPSEEAEASTKPTSCGANDKLFTEAVCIFET